MYAVIETGGKQYKVKEGDVITIEKLNAQAGDAVEFDKVLLVSNNGDVQVGVPYLDAAKVFGSVVENGKAQKVVIFKYKSKKDYRKKQGHRQPYTMVQIDGVSATGQLLEKKVAPKPAEVPQVEAISETPVEVEEQKAEKKVSIKAMKKAELIAFANENNIAIDEKAKNADLIAVIEAAIK